MFERNIEEIKASRTLQIYGIFVAGTHLLSFLFWEISRPAHWLLSKRVEPICWPFFENCHQFRWFSADSLHVLMYLYGIAAAGCGILFIFRRIPLAYGTLFGLEVFKTLLLAQDYRLWMAHHYMSFFISLVFLFFPEKLKLLRLMIVSFYFWAGILKCNRDWLSGNILRDEWRLWNSALPAQSAYVLILEIILVWGLLSPNRWIFWAVLSQFILFHIISWHVVGYFYPVLMFCILAVFPLSRLDREETRDNLLFSLFKGHLGAPTYVLLAAFAALQIPPYFQGPDAALRGGGRMLYSLFMFHARVECNSSLVVKHKDGSVQVVDLIKEQIFVDFRKMCEPLVSLNQARSWCRKIHSDPNFLDVDLLLRSRLTKDSEFRTVVDVKDFCRNEPRYHLWGKNEWIQL